jgi:hypothetical protein
LSQNDSPVPGASDTDAPTERNTKTYCPSEDDDYAVDGDETVDLHREHKKITLFNTKFITKHFIYALKSHNNGKEISVTAGLCY